MPKEIRNWITVNLLYAEFNVILGTSLNKLKDKLIADINVPASPKANI